MDETNGEVPPHKTVEELKEILRKQYEEAFKRQKISNDQFLNAWGYHFTERDIENNPISE